MIGRLALRSLTTHPVRSAVLAAGFGTGVAVMAILLGVAAVVLEQAQAPALVGGGDVIVRLSPGVPARLLLSGTLQSEALRDRVRVAAPAHTADLYLFTKRPDDSPSRAGVRVAARGGIPSLERALGDPETTQVAAWRDTEDDIAWIRETPEHALRQIDRFHKVPDAPEWADSWAEWLYFNGHADSARFYLTFLVGPRGPDGLRPAGVRLQLERAGKTETFSASASLTEDEVSRAPDLTIGASRVRLDGMQYRIHLDLNGTGGRRVIGNLTLDATPGRLVPPLEIAGARGWRTGYVVPVMAGRLGGTLLVTRAGASPASPNRSVSTERLSLDGGTGYHDHNWGFWEGVTWQWGQVQHEGLSFIYGRIFPPANAADPERIPGFVGALGPDGPLGYATDVRISETNDAAGRPRRIAIRARGAALDLTMTFDASSVIVSRMTQGRGQDVDFYQMRGAYTVTGRAGRLAIAFTAPGSAETFRGARAVK